MAYQSELETDRRDAVRNLYPGTGRKTIRPIRGTNFSIQIIIIMYMEYDIAIIGGGPAGYTAARKGFREWIKNDPFREERYRWRLPKRGMYPDKNSFILRQDTRQYQKCLQIWYSGDERPKFRLGKDYRPEEQDRP